MRTHRVEFESPLPVTQVSRALNQKSAQLRAAIAPVRDLSRPLDPARGVPPSVAVAISRAALANMWMVHAYLYVLEDGSTGISLVALSDGGFSRAMAEAQLSFSLARGTRVMQEIAASIPRGGAWS